MSSIINSENKIKLKLKNYDKNWVKFKRLQERFNLKLGATFSSDKRKKLSGAASMNFWSFCATFTQSITFFFSVQYQ